MKKQGNIKLMEFFSLCPPLSYKKNSLILYAGSNPPGVYFVKKGYIRAYLISEAGQEFTPIIFQPSDVFPLSWAMNNVSNRYCIDTITDAEFFICPKEVFIEFLKKNPQELFTLTSKILVRLEGLFQRAEMLALGNATKKVASILTICADRFGEVRGKSIIIKVPLAHKDIASLLGMTRETVSIEMKNLEKRNIISYKRKIIRILNKKALFEKIL